MNQWNWIKLKITKLNPPHPLHLVDIHRPFREYFDIQQTSSGVRVVVKKNSSVGGPRNGRVQLDTERVSIDSPPPTQIFWWTGAATFRLRASPATDSSPNLPLTDWNSRHLLKDDIWSPDPRDLFSLLKIFIFYFLKGNFWIFGVWSIGWWSLVSIFIDIVRVH